MSYDNFSILDVFNILCLKHVTSLLRESIVGLCSCSIHPILSLVLLISALIKAVSVKSLSLLFSNPSFACWDHDDPCLDKYSVNIIPSQLVPTCSYLYLSKSPLPIIYWRLSTLPIIIYWSLLSKPFSSKSLACQVRSHSIVSPADFSSVPLVSGSMGGIIFR